MTLGVGSPTCKQSKTKSLFHGAANISPKDTIRGRTKSEIYITVIIIVYCSIIIENPICFMSIIYDELLPALDNTTLVTLEEGP